MAWVRIPCVAGTRCTDWGGKTLWVRSLYHVSSFSPPAGLRIRDPVPFWPLHSGSEMGKNQDPDPGPRSGSGMNIPDHISESLETIFWDKILQFFDADPDLGSEIFVTLDPGWKIFGPGYGINILNPQHCPSEFRSVLRSGMFIPDPGSWFLPIPDPGSRIQKQQIKTGVKRNLLSYLLKLKTIYLWNAEEKNLGQFPINYRTFYPKNWH